MFQLFKKVTLPPLYIIKYIVKPQWLKNLKDHGNLFDMVVRAIEGKPLCHVRKQMMII